LSRTIQENDTPAPVGYEVANPFQFLALEKALGYFAEYQQVVGEESFLVGGKDVSFLAAG
jgi:hypothetical protein